MGRRDKNNGELSDIDMNAFILPEDSQLYPNGLFYLVRRRTLNLLVGSMHNKYDDFTPIRKGFERVRDAFPENRIVRMYLGEPYTPSTEYPPLDEAPGWANDQREALERQMYLIYWWIDHRQKADGTFGGGYGDDIEMWRWWMPALVAFQDPKLTQSWERLSRFVLSRPELADGYSAILDNIQHSSEPTEPEEKLGAEMIEDSGEYAVGITDVIAKYAYLTDSGEFDELLAIDNSNPYIRFRANKDGALLTEYMRWPAPGID